MLKVKNKNYFKDIYFGEIHIATFVNVNKAPKGLNFVTEDSKFIQLGIWNYKKNKKLDNHYHNYFKRESFRTCEFVFVLKGKIKCELYTEEGDFITELLIKKGQGILQHNYAHKYTIMKNSIIIETKNGPYFGVEIDKKVINEK